MVNMLRTWSARAINPLNMQEFNRGQYVEASEDKELVETISKVLYPEDNHEKGKELRLKQQYFLSSASVQFAVRDFEKTYGPRWDMLPDKVMFQVNDTHPGLAIPELMRVLIDEKGLGWDEAEAITRRCFAYTNHTVMQEALERWPERMVSMLIPRIYMILQEMNRRLCADLWNHFPGEWNRISQMAILAYNQVHMANLAVIGSHSINGVSKLHSQILRESVFKDFYRMYPERFDNVTNGIAHRRWLCYSNPGLASLLDECIGTGYRHHPEQLADFAKFVDDPTVLARVRDIKHRNKVAFARHLYEKTGQKLDTHSLYDVQIKRLHEYKRQLLNALNIIGLYLDLKENPNRDVQPITFLFGAKAAPGYQMAKRIIQLLCMLSKEIGSQPAVREKLNVIFLENYDVTTAERLVPSANISEQISLAGKEASGTGCMKLMMNGALTIGTVDGANVEMLDAVGKENMFIFGLTSAEVEELWLRSYRSADYYANNERLGRIISALSVGFGGESFADIAGYLLNGHGVADPYMCLADFESYRMTHQHAVEQYRDRTAWTRMSLLNTADSGFFAADRSIREYADRIWKLKPVQ